MPKLKVKTAKRRTTCPVPDGHLRPKQIVGGAAGGSGVVLGVTLPGNAITTYRIPLGQARRVLKELPKAIYLA